MVKHTKLREVPAGTTFTVWDHRFTVLKQDEDRTFVLAAEFATTMPFRRSEDEYKVGYNDFRDSSVRAYLEGPYMDELVKAGADRNGDILPLSIDLKSPDGQREYGFDVVSAGLLTLEQYGEFWQLIPLLDDDGWWLASPYKTPNRSPCCSSSNGATYAFYVLSGGGWSSNSCSLSCGIRPALNLNSELLVSWESEGDEEGCEFCNTFDFGAASYEVDKYGARVLLAGGYNGFPKERQFRFCPVCGRELKNNDEEE